MNCVATLQVKADYNPIMKDTQRDPTTAWQDVATKEWRLTSYTGDVVGSMDFKTWYGYSFQK
jgi:hypothetical protein